jgi:hypothetical protein
MAQNFKTSILIIGSGHLAQVYKKEYSDTNVLTSKNEKEIWGVALILKAYQPGCKQTMRKSF